MKPIFSNDPEAIQKLAQKIAQLEGEQEFMKMINAGYKKHGIEWVQGKVSPETYRFYQSGLHYSLNKNRFYPAWALSNNSAVIRSTKKRLAQLTLRDEK